MKVEIINYLKTERISLDYWELTDDFIVSIDLKDIVVPKGFVTDGSSTPCILWSLCPPMAGYFGEAGVVHDFLYNVRSNITDRQYADQVFKEIGIYRGASSITANLLYYGLRLLGGSRWKKNMNMK